MLVVAAALTDAEGRVLVQRRPEGKSLAGLWEFPGGKVEPGESPEAALVRELTEELGIAAELSALAPVSFVSVPLADRQLVMLLYRLRAWQGEPHPYHASALLWADAAELAALDMPPADVPLVAALSSASA